LTQRWHAQIFIGLSPLVVNLLHVCRKDWRY